MQNALRSGVLVALALAASPPSLAQTFVRYGTEAGLPSSQVTAIERDALGFLWAGTLNGLCRLDGLDFRCFRHVPGVPTSLRDDLVRPNGLHLDDAGRLWIGTDDGLQWYDPESGAFLDAVPGVLLGVPITGIDHDGTGRLWVGTERGLVEWDPNSGALAEHRLARPGNPPEPIRAVRVGPDGTIWIGTRQALWYRPPGARSFSRRSTEASLSNVFAVLPRPDGSAWVGALGGGVWYVPEAGRPEPVPLDGTVRITALDDAGPGTLWISSWDGGLLHFDEATRSVIQSFRPSPGRPGGLPNITVSDVYTHETTGTWVATWDGLARLRPPPPFLQLTPQEGRDGLVTALSRRRTGGVWIGTLSGLYVARTDRPPALWEFVDNTSDLAIRALSETRDGTLWIGTETEGLWRRPLGGGRPNRAFENELPSPLIQALALDREGTLWIGLADAGVCASAPPYRKLRCMDASDGLPTNQIYALASASDGSLWVGTADEGPVVYDGSRFHRPPHDGPDLASAWVTSLAPLSKSSAWVATLDGLASISAESPPLWIQPRDGLPHPSATCVVEDERGEVWIGTGNGLARLSPRTGRVARFTSTDGLPAQAFSWGPCLATENGLWFGTRDGLVGVQPARHPRDPPPPAIAFTALDVDGAARPVGQTRALSVQAPSGTRRITLTVTGLDYTNPEGLRYTYRIAGVDSSWYPLGADGRLELTGLGPGDYTVRIRALSGLGVASPSDAVASITVRGPLWTRWWFLLSALAFLGLVGYAGYRYRLRHILALHRTRQRIADDLHDDIGSRVSSLAVQLRLTGRGAPAPIAEQLARHGAQAQALVADLRDTIWVVDSSSDTLGDLVRRTRQIAFDLLPDLEVVVDVDDDLQGLRVSMFARRHLLFFHKEALHNVHRHASASRVRISVFRDREAVLFDLQDDGVGFDAATDAETIGRGLQTLRSRAHALAGDLTTVSTPGGGTRHLLRVPTSSLLGEPRMAESRDSAFS